VRVKCLKLLLYHLTERQEPRTENYKEDFFKETNLTVSGQLEKLCNGFRSDIHLWTYI
jgi:hypothetical protein